MDMCGSAVAIHIHMLHSKKNAFEAGRKKQQLNHLHPTQLCIIENIQRIRNEWIIIIVIFIFGAVYMFIFSFSSHRGRSRKSVPNNLFYFWYFSDQRR